MEFDSHFQAFFFFNSFSFSFPVCCAQSLSRVWLFVTPWIVAYQAPLSMEFSRQEFWSDQKKKKKRMLEWVAISYSRRSSQPRDRGHVSCIGRQILYHCPTWEAPIKCFFLLLSPLESYWVVELLIWTSKFKCWHYILWCLKWALKTTFI